MSIEQAIATVHVLYCEINQILQVSINTFEYSHNKCISVS